MGGGTFGKRNGRCESPAWLESEEGFVHGLLSFFWKHPARSISEQGLNGHRGKKKSELEILNIYWSEFFMNPHSYLIPHSVSSTIRKTEEGREKRIFGDALVQEHVSSCCLYAPVEGCTPQHTLNAYSVFHTGSPDCCKTLRSPGYSSFLSLLNYKSYNRTQELFLFTAAVKLSPSHTSRAESA